MFHGYQPKVEEIEKRKGGRYIKTGDATAVCPECARQADDRLVFACIGDIVRKWNRYNPVFETEEERKKACREQLWKERDEYAKELAAARKEVDRLSELVQFKEGLIHLI